MKLPFEIPMIKESISRKKDDTIQAAALYERTLAEYRETLESYRKGILEYLGKLEDYDKRSMDNQLSIVQTALDMTYIKEQADKTADMTDTLTRQLDTFGNRLEELKTGPVSKTLAGLESLSTLTADTNYKVEALDKNVVNRLSELLLELQKQTIYQNKQLQTEVLTSVDKLSQSVKKSHTLLWFLIAFNILGLSALAFMVLYIMEIIPF
jgi:hypothetical protein